YEKDIIYLEVFAHDIVFHLYEGEIHVRGTLSEYEKKLSPQMFCRINSCYIVNLSCITAIKNMSVLIRDIELRISYSRKKALMRAFSNYVAEKG
ncbi:MAG: LytR/AlgR family response regulator transcription factor, partial [Candidatus Coproplasma sp.]